MIPEIGSRNNINNFIPELFLISRKNVLSLKPSPYISTCRRAADSHQKFQSLCDTTLANKFAFLN